MALTTNSSDFFDEIKDNGLNNEKQECSNLLESSGFDDEYKSSIEEELWHYSEEELNKLKAMLYMNQVDRIDSGLRYSQTDIKNKLKQF